MKFINVNSVEVYVRGLCVGEHGSAVIGENEVSISKLYVKHYPVYKITIMDIESECIITYKYKRKKYAVSGTLKSVLLTVEHGGMDFLIANLEVSISDFIFP
jgi:hypothetical protein